MRKLLGAVASEFRNLHPNVSRRKPLSVQLLIQPGDGVAPLVKAIRKAKKSIEILIFRFDRSEIEKALVEAVDRGVFVHALIAFTNRGGEKNLRKLESHLLAKGITVARTAGDLVRYHGKMMLIDRKELHLLAFNLTHLDIDHSRSFGLVTRNPKLVQEAVNLFEADTKRQTYVPGIDRFLVSPVNARKQLAQFIKGAKKELLIYDPKISDRAMLRLLQQKLNDGVKVRVIGSVTGGRLPVKELTRMRLHTRTIVRDRHTAFVGSQSLRQLELDARREIGVIFRDAKLTKNLIRTFEEDWAASEAAKLRDVEPALKAAKKVAKHITKKIPVGPVVKHVIKTIEKEANVELDPKAVEGSLKAAVKEVLGESIRKASKEVIKETVRSETA
jgi:phosphatidylserine/phosphatidylglycerophosphate/cardiolipin synthase-like enzyme